MGDVDIDHNGTSQALKNSDRKSIIDKLQDLISRSGNLESLVNEIKQLQETLINENSSTLVRDRSKPTAENTNGELNIAQCTAENWKLFFEYRKKASETSTSYEVVDAQLFEQDLSKEEKPHPLLITQVQNDPIVLTLQSPYLLGIFRETIGMQNYDSITPLANSIEIASPFIPFYHHLEDMKKRSLTDSDVTPEEKGYFDALYNFFTLGFPQEKFRNIREIIRQGVIMYEDLWALFRIGDMVVSMDPTGSSEISQVSSVKKEYSNNGPGTLNMPDSYTPDRRLWTVTTNQLLFSRGKFRMRAFTRQIPPFSGPKRIEDLDFYPLAHHENPEKLRELLLRRGLSWKEYHECEPKVMSYTGPALSLTGGSTFDSPSGGYHTVKLSASIIIDREGKSKATAHANLKDRRLLSHPAFSDEFYDITDVHDFNDELYITCPSNIVIFSLESHEWYLVEVDKVKEKVWNPAAFDRLVLEPYKKDTLKRLAIVNSSRHGEKSKDVIEGKGKGMVFLLHGPPGVGKTLTAEVLSELTQRPLLKVNLGRIASHDSWEEVLEQIFCLAEEWHAILLIDEAEIVLEERTFERMTQNSWISVFLRKLEYYKGILILTTNLIDRMDKAFESRISYAIQFMDLSRQDRHHIWTDFITALDMFPAYKKNLLDKVDQWADIEINGRQIRNVILMAENLAAADELHPRLTSDHIDQILTNTIEFCEYNNSYASRAKKPHLDVW